MKVVDLEGMPDSERAYWLYHEVGVITKTFKPGMKIAGLETPVRITQYPSDEDLSRMPKGGY